VWCLGSDIHTWAKKPFFRGLTRRVLNDADLLYADGFALSRDVTALCGRPCEFLATTRVLVELAEEPPELAPDKTHFLYVGRWEKVKGLDVLLDAWRLIAERGLAGKALLHVAGQGQGLERRLSEAARDANLKGSVRIVGWATEAQLAGLYRAVDCVVIPSRNESIPVVLSEALGADTPLIVTNVGDMGTIVKRYQLGYVVPPESPSTLADAIAAFLARPHVFDRSKLADARRLFDIDQSARTFLAHACRIVGRPFHTTSGQEASACEKP
jgi:glycosyltransferase involved in cell wall biosynthesis